MRVYLLWQGAYSDAYVSAVYSTLELARAAEALDAGHLISEDGYEVDENAGAIREGLSRWHLVMRADSGDVTTANAYAIGTSARPTVKPYGQNRIIVECDARDQAHAVKIAGDERARFLAEGGLS